MEQVLHPERYFAGEAPRSVSPAVAAPSGAKPLSEGVLGELFLRTLLGDGAEAAAEGWGGDSWRLWDASGRTALAWRSEWDTTRDADEFWAALRSRFVHRHGAASARAGWDVFGAGAEERVFALRRDGDSVSLVSADDASLLDEMLSGRPGADAGAGSNDIGNSLDFAGLTNRVPAAEPGAGDASGGPDEGGSMATSTPGGTSGTNLGMAPNTAGLLCYAPCCIGLVFSIVAAIVEKQSRFVRFHAFQSLLLNAAAFVVLIGLSIVGAVLGGLVGFFISTVMWGLQMLIGLGFLALTIYLMIKANAGEEIELPVVGPMARGWA
jgi:uncharacterized membrane protein